MSSSFLQAPYNQRSAEAILGYFQMRSGIEYFPVLDAEQTTPEQIAGVLANRFTLNGECHQLPPDFDWTCNPSPDREWQILLHKFYYAVGLGKEYHASQECRYLDKWVELTGSWIDQVSLDFLSSDVTGRRVQNWIFAYYYFVRQTPKAPLPADFHLKFLQSLHSQVCYLCEHLTPARNHRTIELYAIFLAALVFPEMEDAEQWLTFSRQLLLENLQADLLSDGVHCELSTDYHHLVIRNYLGIVKLARLNHIEMPTEIDLLLQKALDFAKYVHKPDGMIPALSDGDVRSFRELLQQGYELTGDEELLFVATQGTQGRSPSLRSRLFPASGYALLRSGWGDDAKAQSSGESFVEQRYLAFDCGPLGAGNHGHLDLLSFEMAAYGRSLIVDPGRYTYYEPQPESGEINWRARFRGTSYHNTVQVDGKEQTRYEFQKTRTRICGPAAEYEFKQAILGGEYDFLHGMAHSHEVPIIHERKILFAQPWYWIVTDILRPEVAGHLGEQHTFDLRFHLSDEAYGKFRIKAIDGQAIVDAPHLLMIHQAMVGGVPVPSQGFIEEAYISRTYGEKLPAPVVRFHYLGDSALMHTLLYPYKEERPRITLASLPVTYQGQPCAPTEAFALEITVQGNERSYIDTFFCSNAGHKYSFGSQSCDLPLLFERRQGVMERSTLP